MKRLADYLQYMQTKDVLAATQEAKVEARALLEDQGVAVLALLLADLLTEVMQQGTGKAAFPTLTRTSAAS